LSDRQASYDNARRNYERARELLPSKGHISRLDHDRTETSLQERRGRPAASRDRNLAYAVLRAPFAGTVSRKRMVQRFEEVAPKQPVIMLQQLHALEVKIDLPERLLRSLDAHAHMSVDGAASEASAWVVFDGIPERHIALELVEAATRADPQTQTYELTFRMTDAAELVVLPGMSATVTVDISRLLRAEPQTWVPASAVTADVTLAAMVWVLDPATMKVARRAVRTGEMQQERIQHPRPACAKVTRRSSPSAPAHMADGVKRLAHARSAEQAAPARRRTRIEAPVATS
jgi:RND family efflux transporter MFP subunit